MRLRVLLALSLLCACVTAPHQTASHVPAPVGTTLQDSVRGKPGDPDTAKIKPYSKIIPANAVTQNGLFITHRVGEKLYFEIPSRTLNKDMLLVGRYIRGSVGGSFSGERFASLTLRWERQGDRIILRSPSYISVADSTLPVYQAVVASNAPSIIAIFSVETYGPDSAAVVDVTRLYTTAIPEFVTGRGQLDEKRSFIERVASFPDNVEIEATQTINPANPAPDASPTARSVVGHWSMIVLPDHPMIPRRADERVGFSSIDQKTDFGTAEQRAATRSYIARFRLEKKDPAAAESNPVKPIIYYIDPATPDQWKPWVRKGVLEWQAAFTAAGFTNAILPMDVPTNDPDWSVDDVRHTVVHWLPSVSENAYAEVTGLQDPRTGETLNGSVFIFHNVLKLLHDWYFTQVGPLDPRAQSMTFPDSLMGRLLQYVVAHEIGHALGLDHDQLGSSLYPADSVRSPTWVARMGHTPSLMDYSRLNYVAQPEDHIAVGDLIPRLGPYDIFAIKWGYTPIPGAHTSDDERPTLDRWAMAQDTVPWYRWVNGGTRGTMAEYSEAVGDADAVWATGWGVKNLQRVMQILPRVALRPGEDNTDLRALYNGVVGQWQGEMRHVASVVGASTVHPKSGSQPGAVYIPLGRARQQAAVRFLNENVFKTPTFLIDETIASRLETDGMLLRINGAQSAVLARLLNDSRLTRLVEFAARPELRGDAYLLSEMLDDVRHGIWTELSASHVTISTYRRALQSSYLDQIARKLAPSDSTTAAAPQQGQPVILASDIVSAFRGELVMLRDEVRRALRHTSDRMTRMHLQTAEFRIERILDPKR